MATVAAPIAISERQPDVLSDTPRAHAVGHLDLCVHGRLVHHIVPAGSIPSSLTKIAAVALAQQRIADDQYQDQHQHRPDGAADVTPHCRVP
ncbi:MAG TPA: hypothetical protein VEB39_08885 [Sphingomicrobium sp.]|nr:hypothetical protein [Sphingomicrobium sp.]